MTEIARNLRKMSFLLGHEAKHWLRITKGVHCGEAMVRKALVQVRRRGYVKIDRFWDSAVVKAWGTRLDTFYVKNQCPTASTYVRPGGTRWQFVERDFPDLLPFYGRDSFICRVVEAYQGEARLRRLMYQYSYYDPQSSVLAEQERFFDLALGRWWHADSWRHGLKALLFLSDISSENGPFVFVPGSHQLLPDSTVHYRLRRYWQILPPDPFDSDNLYFDLSQVERMRLGYKGLPITGSAGTLVIVDTRGLHRAALIQRGERKVLWAYFSQ